MYYLLCCFFNLLLRFFVDTHSLFSFVVGYLCTYGMLRIIIYYMFLVDSILGMECPLRHRRPIRGMLYQLGFVSTAWGCILLFPKHRICAIWNSRGLSSDKHEYLSVVVKRNCCIVYYST
jgi:hypothetical protein